MQKASVDIRAELARENAASGMAEAPRAARPLDEELNKYSAEHPIEVLRRRDDLPEGVRATASHLRSNYDMKNHAVAAGDHAQAIDSEFIHRFGIAGPADEASKRLTELAETGLDFIRVVPGSRDMPPAVGGQSIQGLAKVVSELGWGG